MGLRGRAGAPAGPWPSASAQPASASESASAQRANASASDQWASASASASTQGSSASASASAQRASASASASAHRASAVCRRFGSAGGGQAVAARHLTRIGSRAGRRFARGIRGVREGGRLWGRGPWTLSEPAAPTAAVGGGDPAHSSCRPMIRILGRESAGRVVLCRRGGGGQGGVEEEVGGGGGGGLGWE